MNPFFLFVSLLVLAPTLAFVFQTKRPSFNQAVTSLSAVAQKSAPKVVGSIQAPDFYWKYRLERLESRHGKDYPFNIKNYPHATGYRKQYDVYFLDLVLNGKIGKVNLAQENNVSDEEWVAIYENIANWTKKTSSENKQVYTLPDDDFELVKQFFPKVNYGELDETLTASEVGAKFPYKSHREMINAAIKGTFKVEGYSAPTDTTTLEAKNARKRLDELEKTFMGRLEKIKQEGLALAENMVPDEQARAHYKKLKERMAKSPKTQAEWAAYRVNTEKEVEEMAQLASKKVEHHHHHAEGDEHGEHHAPELTPAQEFEQKYGRNLDKMRDLYTRYKQDPVNFMEKEMTATKGKRALDGWKRTQQFANKIKVMSDSDKQKVEKQFADFMKSV